MELFAPRSNCFVAHFDMLGMRTIIQEDLDQAWDLLLDFEDARTQSRDLPLSEDTRRSIREIVFSDTVVFISQADGPGDLHAIIARSLELFRASFAGGIPVRGVIAHGSMAISDDPLRFIGQALVDAHDLGESQKILGVSLQREATLLFERNPFKFTSGAHVLVDWDVPTQQGSENRSVLNWPPFCHTYFPKGFPVTPEELYGRFKREEFACLPQEVQQKYKNTLEFILYSSQVIPRTS